MLQEVIINPIFARHETFHPRFGWLKKGYDKLIEKNSLFYDDTASVVLGVGKNMVKAIKYWCLAFKIIEEYKDNGKSNFKPTQFAEKLFSDNGWDPYLENPASLWLLHWKLFKSPCYAPVWYFAFNEFNKIDFSTDDFLSLLKEYKNRLYPENNVNDSSLKKDINCLLRMYIDKTEKSMKEDSLNCPFTDLGIIEPYADSKRYTFNFSNKQSLPPEMIVYACLDFAADNNDEARTIALSRLLYDGGSPGKVYKLTESTLSEAIEIISSEYKGIYLTDTAGLIQLAYDGDPIDLSEGILTSYYKIRH